MLSEEDYDKKIEVLLNHAGSSFVQVKLSHIRFLNGNCNAAIVLAYILNLLRMKNENRRDRKLLMKSNLWFRCPAKDIQAHLCMKEDKQRGAVESLVKNGIIKSDKRAGNIQWIRVMGTKLTEIDKWERTRNGEKQKRENPGTGNGHSPEQETGKSGIPLTKNHSEESDKNCCSQARNGLDENSSNEKTSTSDNSHFSPQMMLAKRLHAILTQHKKLTRYIKNLNPWATRFKELLEFHSFKHILKVLNWYGEKEHMNWKSTPQLYAANTFCDEFTRMENAVKNWKRDVEGIEEPTSDIPDWAKNPDGTIKRMASGAPVWMP